MNGTLHTIGTDVLEIRSGGGCMAVFGLPFMAAGVLMLLMVTGIVPVQNAHEVGEESWLVLALFSLVFTAVGSSLVLGRRSIMLDRRRGVIVDQWRLLIPLRSREQLLGRYDAVALSFQSGDSDSADSYPVVLRARSKGAAQQLYTSSDYARSRDAALQIARFFGVPLSDASTDHETNLPPHLADQSLRERATDEGPWPEAPPSLRSRISIADGAVRIVIPGPGFQIAALIGVLTPSSVLAVAIPWLLRFFERTRTPDFVQIGFVAFLVLLFGMIPTLAALGGLIRGMRGQTVITSSPSGIVVEERGAWRTHTQRLAADDILDLDYATASSARAQARRLAVEKLTEAGDRLSEKTRQRALHWAQRAASWAPSRGIIVKTRSGLVTLAAGLSDAETRYLHALIKKALLTRGDGVSNLSISRRGAPP